MRLGEPELPALLVAHHRPGFYMRVITEGQVQAGDEIVKTRSGPHALSVADIDALLYLPDRDRAKLRAAVDIPALSPGWQQSFRELLDGAEDGGRRRRRRPSAPSRLDRVPAAARRRACVPRELRPCRRSTWPPDDGTRCRRPRAGPVPDAAGRPEPATRRRCAATRCPSTPGAGTLPDQRQARAARHRQHATSHRTLRPGATLDVAAPRGEFVLDRRDRPGAAHLGRHRRHAGPGDAAPARGTAQRPRRLVDPRRPRTARARVRRRGARDCSQSLPNAHEHVFYSRPTAARTSTAATPCRAGITRAELAGSVFRPTPTPTSAARPRS